MLRRHAIDASPPSGANRASLAQTISGHGLLLARLAGLSAYNAVSFYRVLVYNVSWLQLADGIAPARALEYGVPAVHDGGVRRHLAGAALSFATILSYRETSTMALETA